MARQPQVQYINACVSGSMAYQLEKEIVRKKKKVVLPKYKREKKLVIALDPTAIGGILVAAMLMVLLMVGFVRWQDARNEAAQMEAYVTSLQEQNRQLSETYAAGYDLEEIRKIALAMGFVPSSQVSQVQMEVIVPQPVQEPTAWEAFCTFLTGLFA